MNSGLWGSKGKLDNTHLYQVTSIASSYKEGSSLLIVKTLNLTVEYAFQLEAYI